MLYIYIFFILLNDLNGFLILFLSVFMPRNLIGNNLNIFFLFQVSCIFFLNGKSVDSAFY